MAKNRVKGRWGWVWTPVTWVFVVINLAPILWMLWCSLMGNNEILQGKTVPAPKGNDLTLVKSLKNGTQMLMGTLNGVIYQYNLKDSLDAIDELDMGVVATSYYVEGDSLWVLSADGGLARVDLSRMSVQEKFKWGWFEDRFAEIEHTSFIHRPNETKSSYFLGLAEKLDHHPLVAGSWGASLAKATGVVFPSDSTLLDSLNRMLSTDSLVQKALDVWKGTRSWINPVISRLYAKPDRTAAESRELFRWCLAERFPSGVVRHQQALWTDIWVNRIPASGNGTTVLRCGPQELCVALWWDEFPGIAIMNTESKQVDWITLRHGLPVTSIQQMIRVDDHRVLAATDAGLALVDIHQKRVQQVFLYGEAGLPFLDGREIRWSPLDSNRILLSYGQELLIFDYEQGLTTPVVFEGLNSVVSSITAIRVMGDQVYLGTSEGLIATDTSFVTSTRYTNLFMDPVSNSPVDAVIHDIHAVGTDLWVSGASGNFSQINSLDGTVILRHQFAKGGPQLHWRNYQDLWKTIPFGVFLRNSFVICFSVMLISMLVASFASYALARFEFPGKQLFSGSILATQMVPGVLYLIPIFLVFTAVQQYLLINLVNTWHGIIIVYSAFFIPMSTWILRGFFASIPRELEEAALIDGCSPFGAFIRIILPAAIPGIIATGIYVFLLAWDELMFAWVLSTDLTTATIPVGIRLYVGQFGNRFDLLMAAASVATLPVVLLFFLMQRHIVTGLTGGAVKG